MPPGDNNNGYGRIERCPSCSVTAHRIENGWWTLSSKAICNAGDITNEANILARPIAEFLEMPVGKIGEGNLTWLNTQSKPREESSEKAAVEVETSPCGEVREKPCSSAQPRGGNARPATLLPCPGFPRGRPVALRPSLSGGLPFSVFHSLPLLVQV